MEALTVHRLQFAFTITYHYLFPQLTMGLALLIFVFKSLALKTKNERYDDLVRWFSKILGVSFVMGVVTGIPMEFQFGTNWSRFSEHTGSVVGQTLAMEGVFAFFLESSFLYFLLYGERRLSPKGHFMASLLVWLGTWLSGFFIVCTNAWMQHPVGQQLDEQGRLFLVSITDLLLNPWALAQYLHTMTGAVITGSFVVAALCAFHLLRTEHERAMQLGLRVSVIAGLCATLFAAFPSGDWHAKMVNEHQPVSFAAMEGHFHTEHGAGLTLVGQPNMGTLELDNPIVVPRMLSILTHQRWDSKVQGLTEFDRDQWPDNVPLLYYSYHIMAGLGSLFILLMGLSALALWRDKLFSSRPLLWALLLAAPFPFIANTAGWYTAELGRQPWLIYGVMRTADGSSASVSSGNALFSLLGFMGLYALLSILFVFLMVRLIRSGPTPEEGH